jgi:hypothetical protein
VENQVSGKSAASVADMAKKARFCVAQMDKGLALSAFALLETEHFLPYHAPNPDTPQTLNRFYQDMVMSRPRSSVGAAMVIFEVEM